jgi:hypothetical protein
VDSLSIRAILAGLFFGMWPLFMNRSGLNGNMASLAFTLGVLVIVLPFCFSDMGNLLKANWPMIIAAGLAGAIGLLIFNSVLVKSTPVDVGLLFVTMILAQITVPMAYRVIMSGSLSLANGTGFIFAIVAAILLSKG